MYLGVDIGGTKTYIATLNEGGVIAERIKFPTPPSYEMFLGSLKEATTRLSIQDVRAGCVASPGSIDRTEGIGKAFGNLPWRNVHIQSDLEDIFHCPIVVENDANLGGLSESMLLPEGKRVLYITISTGIGVGFIDNRKISPELSNNEGGHMILEYHGDRKPWEEFASGKAIVQRFGKKAVDITDQNSWKRIAHDLAIGFIELITIIQPDIIVVGGSVGCYFERYGAFLIDELQKYSTPLVRIPMIQKAARPDDAVLYGCYDLAVSKYGPASR